MKFVRNTRTACIERRPEGIVVARILAEVQQGLTDAVENIAVCAEACGGERAPIIVDLRQAMPLDAETRHYYTGKQLTDFFTSLAVLVPIGAFGKMMGNVYLRVANPGIPSRLFDSETEAMQWSAQHLKRSPQQREMK
jgi:hypothetical protein